MGMGMGMGISNPYVMIAMNMGVDDVVCSCIALIPEYRSSHAEVQMM